MIITFLAYRAGRPPLRSPLQKPAKTLNASTRSARRMSKMPRSKFSFNLSSPCVRMEALCPAPGTNPHAEERIIAQSHSMNIARTSSDKPASQPHHEQPAATAPLSAPVPLPMHLSPPLSPCISSPACASLSRVPELQPVSLTVDTQGAFVFSACDCVILLRCRTESASETLCTYCTQQAPVRLQTQSSRPFHLLM